MAEWLPTKAIARMTGYSIPGLLAIINRGLIPADHIDVDGKGYVIDSAIIPWLIKHKQEWHAAVKQPDSVIHIPDQLGIQEGLYLTPDEAQRLLAIRELHRRYPSTYERNKAMESDD